MRRKTVKKLHALISGAIVIASLFIVQSVQAANRQSVRNIGENRRVAVSMEKGTSIPQLTISTPSYPIGMRSTETKLIPYRFQESGSGSGEIVSQTLQFYTQYDVPLSEALGPYPTHVSVGSGQATDWNELVYLPKGVFEKAHAMGEYAIILKTSFQGKAQSGAAFHAQASLLILFPPGLFSKLSPDHRATDRSTSPLLNWRSSLGAIDYEYCFDTIDNNSCDTNWTGTYWLSTYDSKAPLQNLPSGTTFYWQVRANNTAGTTYANKGKWWSFTTACNTSAITVTNINDTGAGSLRQAIADICPGGTIHFDASLAGQTIPLASQLFIAKDLIIDGSALSTPITLSGDTDQNGTGDVRVLMVDQGVDVSLIRLTVTKGKNAFGGGVYNRGTLTITNSTFSDNAAISDGGGIYNHDTLKVVDSVFSNNSAVSGAGIFNTGALTVTNSTFFNNSASYGGGIYNFTDFSLTLLNSTFSTNSATTSGAGLYNDHQTTLNFANTLIANSTSGGDCVNLGALSLNANNLVEDGSCSASLQGDPKLGPLSNNGGMTQTMALRRDSPAVDAGDDANCPATDQRGVSRPYGSHCDIGAYEYAKKNGSDTTGVFRPSNGLLYLKNKNETGFADIALNYGLPGDTPVVGDWDGNGTVTIGVYRNGYFYLRNENTIGFATIVFPFGNPGDQPIAGDWDGDGVDTIGTYRPSNGQFFLRNSNGEGAAEMSFYLGNVGDVGIAGDWDGDGLDTTGVFRPSNGLLYLKNRNETGFADIALNYGIPGDKPVTGDWNNDGVDTIGVYRNGTFYLRNSNTIGFAEIVFGLGNPGDMPIAGNWDGLP
jgi:hypothetical protein